MQLGDFNSDVQAELAFAKQELVRSEIAKRNAKANSSPPLATYLLIGAAIVGAVYLIKRRSS
jgi:hypothetical protein